MKPQVDQMELTRFGQNTAIMALTLEVTMLSGTYSDGTCYVEIICHLVVGGANQCKETRQTGHILLRLS